MFGSAGRLNPHRRFKSALGNRPRAVREAPVAFENRVDYRIQLEPLELVERLGKRWIEGRVRVSDERCRDTAARHRRSGDNGLDRIGSFGQSSKLIRLHP